MKFLTKKLNRKRLRADGLEGVLLRRLFIQLEELTRLCIKKGKAFYGLQ